jgi:hypothetical protein
MDQNQRWPLCRLPAHAPYPVRSRIKFLYVSQVADRLQLPKISAPAGSEMLRLRAKAGLDFPAFVHRVSLPSGRKGLVGNPRFPQS